MGDEKRVVWVLGAGFSAGLGGPLLAGLLSRTLEGDVNDRYSAPEFEAVRGNIARHVRNLYEWGLSDPALRSPKSIVHGENLWAHAEAFIEYLDIAAEPPVAGKYNARSDRLRRILRRDLSVNETFTLMQLREAARRLIAAECSAFLEDVDIRSESWRPFQRWAKSLGGADTVITFNYDRVLEILRDTQNAEATDDRERSALYVCLPDDPVVRDGRCNVLKLHGSVDWQRSQAQLSNVVKFQVADPRFALNGPEKELIVATPGPSKLRETERLDSLWSRACDAIKAAQVIIFIGFRFPETDAYAKETLLAAIEKNVAGELPGPWLRTHVVLGRPGYDSQRLQALLEFMGPRNPNSPRHRKIEVKVHPLLSQDFLAVADRADL